MGQKDPKGCPHLSGTLVASSTCQALLPSQHSGLNVIAYNTTAFQDRETETATPLKTTAPLLLHFANRANHKPAQIKKTQNKEAVNEKSRSESTAILAAQRGQQTFLFAS